MTDALTLPAGVQRFRHAGPRPVVVKLGGSVIRSNALQAWLDAIRQGPEPIVIVPGGGALADEVRHSQTAIGFDDLAAHRMALLAMDQLAWAVAGLRADFEVGDSEAALLASLEQNRIAVWAPFSLVAQRPEIPPSWTFTSDSLALWLAGRLAAARCFLVKSVEQRQDAVGAGRLARDGVIDEAFPAMLQSVQIPAYLVGAGEQAALSDALANGAACGTAISLDA
jgi:aspartokinase-like uncharacterized kinase